MSDYLAMIPQQCQEVDCKIVYRCKIKSDNYEIMAQCKSCSFDNGCQAQEKIDVLLPELGICTTCYQCLMEA